VELRVLGCHGGETPNHRTSAFLLDGRLAIDAGALTGVLDLPAQCALEACVVSHAHLDHVRDLATLADNRAQLAAPPLVVAGTDITLDILRKHFFNDLLWPDFTKIPSEETPTIVFRSLSPEVPTVLAGFTVQAVLVNHTLECAGFVIEGKDGSLAYSGDTGPTDRFWQVLNDVERLRALLIEVSLPDEHQILATRSGHHTPTTLYNDLFKYKKPSDLNVLLYHMKPVFQGPVERQCAAIPGLTLAVLGLGNRFQL
jgi:3',5'-cyclic-nucleotide phosphodiesterase